MIEDLFEIAAERGQRRPASFEALQQDGRTALILEQDPVGVTHSCKHEPSGAEVARVRIGRKIRPMLHQTNRRIAEVGRGQDPVDVGKRAQVSNNSREIASKQRADASPRTRRRTERVRSARSADRSRTPLSLSELVVMTRRRSRFPRRRADPDDRGRECPAPSP